jgi:hypothetical protein
MKRYIFAILYCFAAVITYAECTTLTGASIAISRWYDFYMPVVGGEMECWTVELAGEGPYQIRYNIDLDQFEADDMVRIYEIANDSTLQLLKTFSAVTMSGAIVTSSKNFRVEYYGSTGKLTEEYFDGFQLYFEKATHEYAAIHDYYVLGRLGIGTFSPNYKLDVRGTIRANEIIVNTTGADFVFADDYQLRPLSEVKAFIIENKHLPEIKSAQEMQENGVGINELQTQLLQKIEELTLYILQQEERIKALEAELNK